MRNIRRLVSIFHTAFLLAALVSCDSALENDGAVEIRVRNASAIDFASVVILFPDQSEAYGPVAAQSATDYRTVERAYRYAGVQVTLADTSLSLVPIDYVGEEELEGGEYTYELNVADGVPSLTLRLVRD